MIPEIVPPGALDPEGGFLTAPMNVHKENGRIVLSQKTRLWFRAAVCCWALVVLSTPFMIYSEWFSSETTHFTCERATGICELDGRSKDVPPLAEIKRAEMDHSFNRRDGANWGIDLITRDGKKYPIEQQRAIKDSVIAEYRSTAKTINAYLANPGQQKLDVSFTYVAGGSEKLVSIFYFLTGIVMLGLGLGLWTKRRYVFGSEKVTLMVGGPFRRKKQELATRRIGALVDRRVADRRSIELRVDGENGVAVVSGREQAASDLDRLSLDLAEFLGKPAKGLRPDKLVSHQ